VGVDRPDTRATWDANAPAWIELSRAGFDVYRDLVNTPAFFSMLPPVDGLRCLDLGCGEGHNTRLLAARGADVVALDISEVFIEATSKIADSGTRYIVGDGALLPFVSAAFDAVTAFMSLMDVADPEAALHEIARVLRPGGFLQFSVVHPATSTPVAAGSTTRRASVTHWPSVTTSSKALSAKPGPSGPRRQRCAPGFDRSRSPTPDARSPAGSTRY
jgi:SAM-dependent methyltransferase